MRQKEKHTSDMVRDRLVQLELHSAKPVRDVGVLEALDKHGPRVRVVVGNALGFRIRLLIERLRRRAVYEGPKNLHTFYALSRAAGGCHDKSRRAFVTWWGQD